MAGARYEAVIAHAYRPRLRVVPRFVTLSLHILDHPLSSTQIHCISSGSLWPVHVCHVSEQVVGYLHTITGRNLLLPGYLSLHALEEVVGVHITSLESIGLGLYSGQSLL